MEDAIKNSSLPVSSSSPGPIAGDLLGKLRWYWLVKAKPNVNRTLAVIFVVLSIVTLVSECTLLVEGAFDNFVYEIYKHILTKVYVQAIVSFWFITSC